MEPIVGLLRRFAVEFMNGHNAAVCTEIMAPDYVLRIGAVVLSGRDREYVPAVQSQLDQFPGLGMTVHSVITNGEQIAVQFSEHGASPTRGGRVASWAGIAMYRWNGTQLTQCAAEEDYYARRRQLTTDTPDPVDRPTPAPWDTRALPPDPKAEEVVRRWLAGDNRDAATVSFDDEHLGSPPRFVFEADETEITDLFSAGEHVAFHTRQSGHYLSGFDDLPSAASGAPVDLYSAGVARITNGAVREARVIRGRLDVYTSLRRLQAKGPA